jgi:enoyl-CoA hydratase
VSGLVHEPEETEMTYETLLVETRGRVGLVTLNRPQALNALNSTVMRELAAALKAFDADKEIGAVVLAGSEKAFAAGADIKEMQTLDFVDSYLGDFIGGWDQVAAARKPLIAAVSGYALGGGCELAMMCDFIIASETAKFGQPEITLGVIPGMGGSQRLTRAVGKAKAMDLVLTGRMMDAAEAERAGLVSRVVAPEKLMEEVLTAAEKIASFSLPAVMMAKEAVSRSLELTLAEGLRFERRLFHSLFATEDQKEGMAAFVAKRKPEFKHR